MQTSSVGGSNGKYEITESWLISFDWVGTFD